MHFQMSPQGKLVPHCEPLTCICLGLGVRARAEVSTKAVSSLVSLTAGDSSQDEAEEDVKQITVSSSPRGRVWVDGQQGHFAVQWSGEQGAGNLYRRCTLVKRMQEQPAPQGPLAGLPRGTAEPLLAELSSGGQDGGPACERCDPGLPEMLGEEAKA